MPKPSPIFKRKERTKDGKCASHLHQQCARILDRVLKNDERKRNGVNLKNLTLGKEVRSKKATHAVVCETLRFLPVIKEVVQRSHTFHTLLKGLTPGGVYVLVYEMLFGQGLMQDGVVERKFQAHEKRLKSTLRQYLHIMNVKDAMELVPRRQEDRPCFARINILKTTKERILESTKRYNPEVIEWIPDVLKFPPRCQLHDDSLVKNGMLFLQGLGSALVAHALEPQPYWKVLDACAAPGHKAIHLGALLKPSGKVLAMDINKDRLQRLKQNVSLAGATNITIKQLDFLEVDFQNKEYQDIDGIVLDPSCSGSGTAFSRMDELLPSTYNQQSALPLRDEKRVKRLAAFQKMMLLHGLSFPSIKRLVYSTCSINEEENEQVIQSVLPQALRQGFGLKSMFPEWKRRGQESYEQNEKMIRIDPAQDETDGFFIAVFERIQ